MERCFRPPEQFRLFRARGIDEGFRHDNPLVLPVEMGMADKRAAHLISFHTPKTTQYAAVFATVGDRLVRKLEALLSLHIRIRERARYVPPHYRITHSDQIIFGKCLLSRIGKTIPRYQSVPYLRYSSPKRNRSLPYRPTYLPARTARYRNGTSTSH